MHIHLARLSPERRRVAAGAEALLRATPLIESPDDFRDIVFVPRVAPAKETLHPDPRDEDQGAVGMCTGMAASSACESLAIDKRAGAYTPGADDFSPLYNYWWSRRYDGLTGDSGATLRSMLRSAKNYGMVPLDVWPMSKSFEEEPPQSVVDIGLQRRVQRYERIELDKDNYNNTLYRIDSALAEGLRVVIGTHWRRWMFYVNGPMGSVGHEAPFPLTDHMNEHVGGHALWTKQRSHKHYPYSAGFYGIKNSWGSAWGDGGDWSCNAMQFTAPHFVFEVWAIRTFDGYEAAPAPRVPLTLGELVAIRRKLVDRGLGRLNPDNTFTFAPVEEAQLAAVWKTCVDVGVRDYEDGQAVLGYPAGTIRDFIEQAHVQGYLRAWK